MANELERTQKQMASAMTASLDNAASIITKNYLDKLETYDLIKPSEEDIDIDVSSCGRFFKLSKLVVNKEENFLDKLTTIVNVVSAIDCSLATIIRSNGYSIDYYFGIISKNHRKDTEMDAKRRAADVSAFHGAITGNLIGSDMEEVSADDVRQFKSEIFENKKHCYSSVSGIVALRDKEEKGIDGYVQGIENLVDSLKGQKYTIIMFADPVSTSEIQIIKQGYEMLYTQLSTFLRSTVTLNESDTVSLAKARSEGVTEGISKGISMTQSKTRSKGRYMGINASVGVSLGITANVGVSGGTNSSTADTVGKTDTTTEINQKNRQVTDTIQSGKTSGKSLQLNYENRSVKSLLDRIDMHLERLDECESFGAFDCAAYVIAESRETSFAVASNYNALMRGKDSSVQASHINTWYKPDETAVIGQYLSSFVHPRFSADKNGQVIVTPASIVSGNEMAIQIGLPKKSVSGVTVVPMAPFGRNIVTGNNQNLTLGNLYHMGHDEGSFSHPQKVEIDVESLSMHTFITGSTGAGKSTAIYSILDKLMNTPVKNGNQEKIKFMVIEPAKGEYKDRFGYYDNVYVYGTNYKKTPLLRINPFSFPKDVHVLEHIDRLIEIFNVCWPMYAAMPAVLKDSIERAYIAAGWKLDVSECKYSDSTGTPLYPNFIDILNQINIVMNESQYSSESKGDYKGALSTRLRSLTNGLYGQIFTSDEIPAKELFDENVIIDLSRTGSSETKSLIMGLLVMKLQEYRMSTATACNRSLQHITVLEEAHNILKRTSTEQSTESSNVLGKSVEMLANSIAEMRTYGEGFIIADQAPGLMDMSVIRNTNTKIILRLPDLSDRELVGRAAGLNDEQILELSRLKTFVAAVYQNNWLEPVLCNIDTNFKKSQRYEAKEPAKTPLINKNAIIQFLLSSPEHKNELDRKYITDLTNTCFKLSIQAEAKVAFIKYVQAKEKTEIQRLRGLIIYSIFNSEIAFDMAKIHESDINSWYLKMCESLDPDMDFFNEADRQRIIAVLTREKAERDETAESTLLFERLMRFM
ncbi:MAG: ATP-binding protein [Lachnospiraceae bacterium]